MLNSEMLNSKNVSPAGLLPPMHTKVIYDLTIAIAIINKCFEFQTNWFKIIPIRYNCTQFCPIPLC